MITMQPPTQARQAYEAAARFRSQRDQEADVFRHATLALKAARGAGAIVRIKALADNRRLWMTVGDVVRDSENTLPEDTKAGIVSIALSVQRELDQESPDYDFLVGMNENMTAALSGHP
jgi:flagellar biosynthesis regulator FlaF